MTSIATRGVSRRSVLAGAGAFGAASLLPRMAVSADGKVLTVRSYSDLQVLDPAFRVSLPEDDIIRAIFAPMVVPKSGDVWDWKPVAVETIEQVDDVTIAFKLRDNIGFTDGFGQMTAEDVKFSIERIADPAMESPYAGDWSALKEVEVKDTLSGLIHLKNKFVPLWATTLPTPASCIVSKKAVTEMGGKFTTEVVAQSGQYLLAEWTPKQKTVLKRNPDWAHEPGGFEEIHIIPIEDPATAELGFEAGDLDYTWTAVSSLPRLKENPPAGSGRAGETLAGLCLAGHQQGQRGAEPDVQHSPRDPARHRPGEVVVDAAYFGAAKVGNGIVAPGLPGSA